MRRMTLIALASVLASAPVTVNAAALVSAVGLAHRAPFDPKATGLQSRVTFTDYTPLSANAELARRLLSPLTAAKLAPALARSGKVLRDQPVDLSAETFAVFVPTHAPAGGYGLLVFVPPWDEAILPEGWGPVLDRLGFIFVTAAKSGNEAEVLSRRAPLAILAAANILARFPVDPDKVFGVGGFSGGIARGHAAPGRRLSGPFPRRLPQRRQRSGRRGRRPDPLGGPVAARSALALCLCHRRARRRALRRGCGEPSEFHAAAGACSAWKPWTHPLERPRHSFRRRSRADADDLDEAGPRRSGQAFGLQGVRRSSPGGAPGPGRRRCAPAGRHRRGRPRNARRSTPNSGGLAGAAPAGTSATDGDQGQVNPSVLPRR